MPSSAFADPAPVPTPIEPGRLAVALFDVPADRLPALAADLRRLAPKPPLFCWLPTVDDAPGRVLVRVEEPPPLVVWRMVDERLGVFTEHSHGIWVHVGLRHPPSDLPRPSVDCIVLVRPDRVETVADANFSGAVEVLSLTPADPALKSGTPVAPISLRLRLAPTGDNESPRLWVLRDNALAQLTAYCRSTHQQLLHRFAVAVSATPGVPCVVVRALDGKGPPPLLVAPAIAYHSLLKLPNLFLPAGTRLAPAIRRDELRSLLAPVSDRVFWLHPLGNGAFRPESLPESAFQPLLDWVDYRVAEGHRAAPWTQSHRWEFIPFVERPNARPRPRPRLDVPVTATASSNSPNLFARTIALIKKLRLRSAKSMSLPAEVGETSVPVEQAVRTALDQGHRLHLARPEAVGVAVERCRTLEARFLKLLPDLQPEGHEQLWAELAAAYDSAANHSDSALCWLNALWEEANPSQLWAWGWVRAEAKAARPEVKAIDPMPWLAAKPGPGTTRALAAWVVWASGQHPPPPVLAERTAEMQARLEAYEHWLPVRAAWLARTAIVRATSADPLGFGAHARSAGRATTRRRARPGLGHSVVFCALPARALASATTIRANF